MNLTYLGAIQNSIHNRHKNNPTLTFKGNESQKLPLEEFSFFSYKNTLPQKLKATPNPNLKEILKKDSTIHDVDIAYTRLTSFSKYLKEAMVGFEIPEGKQWFEDACAFLIKATAGVNVPEVKYSEYAKDFWELLTNVDPYWKSNDFINYLKTLEQNAGVTSTIRVLNNIKKQEVRSSNISFGYDSALRFMPELCNTGGAYTGAPLNIYARADENYPTLEHLFPHSEGGDEVNVDSNFVLALGEANGSRGNIPLIDYLKGWNSDEYYQENPKWKSYTKSQLKTAFNKENEVIRISNKSKKEALKILAQSQNGTLKRKNTSKEVEKILQYVAQERAEVDSLAEEAISALYNNDQEPYCTSSSLVKSRIEYLLAREQIKKINHLEEVALTHLDLSIREDVIRQLKETLELQKDVSQTIKDIRIDINKLPQPLLKNLISKIEHLLLDQGLSEYGKFKNNQPINLSNMDQTVKRFAIDHLTEVSKTDPKAKNLLHIINTTKTNSNSFEGIQPDELPLEIQNFINSYYKDVLTINRVFQTRFAKSDFNLLNSSDKTNYSNLLNKRLRAIKNAKELLTNISTNNSFTLKSDNEFIHIAKQLIKEGPESYSLRRLNQKNADININELPISIKESFINKLNDLISKEADIQDTLDKISNKTSPVDIESLPSFARKYAVSKLMEKCKTPQNKSELIKHIIETQPIYIDSLPDSIAGTIYTDLLNICEDKDKITSLLKKYKWNSPVYVSELPANVKSSVIQQLNKKAKNDTIEIDIPKEISINKTDQTKNNKAKKNIEKILVADNDVNYNSLPLAEKQQVIYEMSSNALKKISEKKPLPINQLPPYLRNTISNTIETQYLNAVLAEKQLETGICNLKELPLAIYKKVISDVGQLRDITKANYKALVGFIYSKSVNAELFPEKFTNYLISKIKSQDEINEDDQTLIYKLQTNKIIKNTELRDLETRLNLNLRDKMNQISEEYVATIDFIDNYSHGETGDFEHLPVNANSINSYLKQLVDSKPVLSELFSKLDSLETLTYSDLPENIQTLVTKTLTNIVNNKRNLK